jgi:NADH-quinone oxidoreductase subunit F
MAPDQPINSQVKIEPGDSQRYAIVDEKLRQFGYRREALLEALNTAQEAYGYLSEDVLRYISDQLSTPLSQVYGVATFFNMFTFEAVGESRLLVCNDPACGIAGSDEVIKALRQHAKSKTSGSAMIEEATCLGLCDQAPAALVNQEAFVELEASSTEALFSGVGTKSKLQVSGEPQILTGRIGKIKPLDLEGHRADGAFSALEKALTEMTPDDVIEAVKSSGLAGRGGAGFPTGLKWQFTRQASGSPKYVVCNFDESEPGTFKDRVMMEGDPFRVLEGMILAGYATGADQGTIFVRAEYPEAAKIVEEAIKELRKAGLIGENILGSSFDFEAVVRHSAGAYICGEETALFEAIEGKRGFPRTKPPFPTTHGLFGKPTAINNVETLALIPEIVMHGGGWFRQWGTEKSPGIKLFCLSGHVNKPGVVELPYGITLRKAIEQHGGGFKGEPQAVLMGGAAGGLLHPDYFDTPLTHEDMQALDLPIGSGVVMVFNQDVELLNVLKRLARFFMHETCGQCVPCRVGTRQAYKLLDKIAAGEGQREDVDRLEHLANSMRAMGLCGLGQTAPSPILSSFQYFREIYPQGDYSSSG